LDFFKEDQSIEGVEGKTPQRARHYYQHATDFHIVFALFLLFQIVWPENWEHGNADGDNVPIFLVSIDGVNCRIQEPTHP
jgi:hypothetical protein